MSDNLYIRIYETRESVIIHNYIIDQVISLDKTYMTISKGSAEALSQKNIDHVHKAAGIMGIVQIGILDYLICIKDSKKVGNIGNTEIFEISEVELLLISFDSSDSKVSKEVSSVIDGLKVLLKQGFYYSSNYDLTNSLQSQKNIKLANNNKYDIIKDSNPQYLWNYELLNRFIEFKDFIVNCINGYVGIHTEELKGRAFSYVLISRRNNMNAGTYNNKRGIDENGNVANFVETEQIVIIDNSVFSFVQLRGTTPLFYPSKKENLQRRDYISIAFNKHIQEMFKSYKLVFLINLMNCLKENEQVLTEAYENLIKENEYKNVKYTYYDIENEIKDNDNKELESLEKLILNLESIFHIFKYFSIYTIGENKIHTEQVGVFRTNCYDGLMRSNFIEMKIAWKIIVIQLKTLGINADEVFTNNSRKSSQEEDSKCELNLIEGLIAGVNLLDKEKSKSIFPDVFKRIWQENNKTLTLQYRSNEDDDALLNDYMKQKCIDILLHKYNFHHYQCKLLFIYSK
jgi:hypothetical protein